MQILFSILLAVSLLAPAFSYAYDNRSQAQRKADEARQQLFDKIKKDKEAKEAAARAKKEAKERSIAEAARKQEREKYEASLREKRKTLYDTDPKAFFAKYIENKLILKEYGLDEPSAISGRIVQILSEDLIIIEVHKNDQWVAVQGYSTKGLIDGLDVTFKVKDAGTFRYTSVLGAIKTILKCTPAETMTYKQFQSYKAKGIDMLDAVESYLLKNKTTWQ